MPTATSPGVSSRISSRLGSRPGDSKRSDPSRQTDLPPTIAMALRPEAASNRQPSRGGTPRASTFAIPIVRARPIRDVPPAWRSDEVLHTLANPRIGTGLGVMDAHGMVDVRARSRARGRLAASHITHQSHSIVLFPDRCDDDSDEREDLDHPSHLADPHAAGSIATRTPADPSAGVDPSYRPSEPISAAGSDGARPFQRFSRPLPGQRGRAHWVKASWETGSCLA
jgi:hypothetical protein